MGVHETSFKLIAKFVNIGLNVRRGQFYFINILKDLKSFFFKDIAKYANFES